jgi:crotonobetainyl-CoA:carnitine CoA-transferase CaiB-like acyl-CoA transferase
MMEHPNRGRRSVSVDISNPDGQQVIYGIAKTADVFLSTDKHLSGDAPARQSEVAER